MVLPVSIPMMETQTRESLQQQIEAQERQLGMLHQQQLEQDRHSEKLQTVPVQAGYVMIPVPDDYLHTGDDMPDLVLPEEARPFQAISYSTNQKLTTKEMVSYLGMVETHAITEMPWKPSGGTVILFKARNESCKNNWRANGHRMVQTKGKRLVMNNTVEIREHSIVTIYIYILTIYKNTFKLNMQECPN